MFLISIYEPLCIFRHSPWVVQRDLCVLWSASCACCEWKTLSLIGLPSAWDFLSPDATLSLLTRFLSPECQWIRCQQNLNSNFLSLPVHVRILHVDFPSISSSTPPLIPCTHYYTYCSVHTIPLGVSPNFFPLVPFLHPRLRGAESSKRMWKQWSAHWRVWCAVLPSETP